MTTATAPPAAAATRRPTQHNTFSYNLFLWMFYGPFVCMCISFLTILVLGVRALVRRYA